MSDFGYCYAAEAADFIKFGFSDDPSIRVSGLRSAAGGPVKLLGYVKGSRQQEARLHELLHRHVSHGEWYFKTDAVVRAAALFPPRRTVPAVTRDMFRTLRSGRDRDEAQKLLRACLKPGCTMLAQLPDMARDLGMTPRRARAIFNREARIITPNEMEALRQLARRARSFFDGEVA